MIAAIKAFFDSLTQCMHAYETHLLEQTTTDVVKDKHSLKKASNITEEILEIVDKYLYLFEEKDMKQYKKLKKEFLKVN